MDIRVSPAHAGKTIREFLTRDLGYSSNLLKRLKFSENGIRVDGQWVTVRHVLREGEVLSLAVEDRPEDVSPYLIPSDLPLGILYEDAWITAVNKPPDMPAHPSQGHHLDTAANALAYRYRDRVYVFRPVNRLDRDTSGCMLTSNTKDASYKMYAAMTEGRIAKRYLAVLDGIPAERAGEIRSYMRRKPDSVIEREECSPDADGAKLAVTRYRVLAESDGRSLVLCSPLTGRTHQLRVQFAGIGCPITGDSLYGTASPLIPRHALHSWQTTFPHPMTGEEMTVTAPLPADMTALLASLGLPAEPPSLPE
ncbi:MAG: RluA family pseudouridine synthase [Clostridia bacterium]|nr:RluA family pseudouridine synthase [Clostridia bacterium]MBR4185184.1 RluA family pseudouridine synthase [Clostridia bacterium]